MHKDDYCNAIFTGEKFVKQAKCLTLGKGFIIK